jgi:ribosomal protein L7/L12
LREEGGLELAEAKQLVDAILENRPADLTLDEPAAKRLADRATECGANVTVEAG